MLDGHFSLQLTANAGQWCVVEADSCTTGEPAGVLAETGDAYDWCGEQTVEQAQLLAAMQAAAAAAPPARTLSNCQCAAAWQYVDPASGVAQTFRSTCENPTSDPAGSWCVVDAKTCEHMPMDQMPNGAAPLTIVETT